MNPTRQQTSTSPLRWLLLIVGAMIIGSVLVNTYWLHRFYPRVSVGPAAVDNAPPIQQKWQFTGAGVITAALALNIDGTVYAASEDGNVYAIDSSGNLQWKFNAGPVTTAPALGVDGTIYVTNGDQRIFAINPTGTQQWANGGGPYADKQMGWIAAALDQTHLYTPSRGQMRAIRLIDGTFDWPTGIGLQRGGSVSILPDGLVVYPGYGRLDAADATGRTQWEYPVMNPPLNTDMIASRRIPIGNFVLESAMAVGDDSTIYACIVDSRLVAVTADGRFKWEFKTKTSSRNRAAPVIAVDGTIYFASGDGTLYALNADGTQKWALETAGGSISVTPILAEDGTIYIVNATALIAVSPDGKILAKSPVDGSVESSPTIAPDGTIYVAWHSGKISAFAGGHGGLMNSSWPKFQATLANSGRSHPI